MGSYADLTLGKLFLADTKNRIDSDLIWLFRPSDKCIEHIDRRNRNQLAKYIMDEYIDDYDEQNPYSLVKYRCKASVVRDRLNLKGFTLEVAEAAFNAGVKYRVRWLENFVHLSPSLTEAVDEELRILNSLTVTDWIEALSRISDEVLKLGSLDTISSMDAQTPLLRYMLQASRDCYGFPNIEKMQFPLFVRLAVEAVSSDEHLVYDLTSLSSGGWIDEADEQVTATENLLYKDLHLVQNIIVLTEGDTDRWALQRSLKLLHPHLSDYFHFFDFTGKKVGGGVGELANLVRAFAAADVRHRILALFDNDAAATESLSTIDQVNIPRTIAIRQYPSIKLAEEYPTIGPSGNVRMDINGQAGSLELYLGRDVLRNSEGELTPVQWSGYKKKLGIWQGSILEKDRILSDFDKKLKCCEADSHKIDNYDWEGVRAILDMMFTAFHELDADVILNNLS